MNVLITGANGFIGKELTKKMLNDGHKVYAVVNNKKDMFDIANDNLKVIELLFEKYNLIAENVNCSIDIAYHLAWDGLSGSKAKDVELQLCNVLATYVLFEQLKKIETKKIVFASSMNTLEVYSYLKCPLDYNPRGVYIHVASKINAEIVLRTLCSEASIQFNSAVIAMAYGENNKSGMIINMVISSLLNGVSPKLISGNNVYDILYVKDIANGLYSIGTYGVNTKSYYVGHNWGKTFKNIIEEIRDIVNPSVELLFGSVLGDNHIDFSYINRDELMIDTGWKPSFDFKESIVNTANWIKLNYTK